ncbi:catalase family protein [Paraburkholderia xenovorans LB400]|uniref:Catalase-related peroxidase n=1 Tax=Paraburkholderia xenovorans (strain LB400) TaxID=266265 RepID=Q143G2_PARXL|nr:catalase family peroxidase [Paraburkholderia xenovorans]ABE29527.1 Putative catalase [Paraburkholderia xenovorans LB400]AIP32842.1 catalase family protein [Paraburkholderia xenovorans LB400]
MADRPTSSTSAVRSLVLIAVIVVALVAAFAYTGGWLSPGRLTPAKIVNGLAPPGGAALGFRRNHAKGICFTGSFESNGAAAALSRAPMLAPGSYPVTGRFNLATADPKAPDATVRVRGLSLRIVAPDRSEWRSAMIDAPVFPVATPQAFYALLEASANKSDPDAMKNFAAAHPEFGAFVAWAGSAPWTGSYAQERYNSLNSFIFTNAAGEDQAVRWSFVPAAQPEAVPVDQLKARAADFLAADITQRVQSGPQRWTLVVTVANPGDPTADPSKAWPEDRRKVEAGTLVVNAIEPEADGPCRDLNFDPTVLPPGMHVSDDPFPAARSAAYSVSFNRRTAEDKDYPRHPAGGATP